MEYIVYDADGVILKSGVCSAEDFELQTASGQFILEGVARADIHCIVNGQVVAKEPLAYDLESGKQSQSAFIKMHCEAEIISGFQSTVLNTSHTYPSNEKDQLNLSGTVQRSLLPSAQPTDVYLFLCADANNIWEYRPHTAAQIQQVGADAYNHILEARVKNATLQAQIAAATTQEELEAIAW